MGFPRCGGGMSATGLQTLSFLLLLALIGYVAFGGAV